MPDLPVMLKVCGKRAVIVGGGSVALRRAKSLMECGAEVTVIAPAVDGAIAELPVRVDRRPFQPGDLAGAFLVVIATDDEAVNDGVHRDAVAGGVLVNRADEPDAGDLVVMAHEHRGPLTLAVATGGVSAKAAAAIRDEWLRELDGDWVKLLEGVAGYRQELKERVPDAAKRQAAMVKLTDSDAMGVFKEGGLAALKDYCDAVLREAESH